MIPSGTRAVVFDAVGTLIHPEPGAAAVYAEVGRRYGTRLELEEIRSRFSAAFRNEDANDRQLGWRTSESRETERWRRIVSAVFDDVTDRAACFDELFAHFARPTSWRCDPHAEAVLVHLARSGYQLAMASNYDARLRRAVAEMPQLQALSHVFISSELGWRKPAREFFAAVYERLSLQPREILYVGDDPVNDYEGATAAGLHSLLISQTSGVHTIASLAELT